MADAPIAECFGKQDKWFCEVVVTDGAGSPRNGLYANYTDEQMKAVRIEEQKNAAIAQKTEELRAKLDAEVDAAFLSVDQHLAAAQQSLPAMKEE